MLKLVDLKKNKVVWKESIGSLIFDLDWNSKGVLAIASAQKYLHLRSYYNGEFIKMANVLMEGNLRCLQFCPCNPALLAVGL